MLTIAASYDLEQDATLPDHGLCLLFIGGARPDREAVREFVRSEQSLSISFDPAARPNLKLVGSEGADASKLAITEDRQPDWLELLSAGLTFDLKGFAPGVPIRAPGVNFSFDFEDMPPIPGFDVLHLLPGRHLAGGEASLPVVAAMLGLARDMVRHFPEVEGVIWPASQSVIGRRFFESSITAWLEGGAFPALGLTAFRETMDGGLQSLGLSYFIGQELRIEPQLVADKVAATRLGIRLVNHLLLLGTLAREEHVIAPDGARLVLVPSQNGKFIRVQPA